MSRKHGSSATGSSGPVICQTKLHLHRAGVGRNARAGSPGTRHGPPSDHAQDARRFSGTSV